MLHPIRTLALLGFFLAVRSTSFAASSDSISTFEPNLKAGDWQIGSSLGVTRQTSSNPKREFDTIHLDQTSEYFLIDRFSLGLAFHWEDRSDDDATLSAGPAATFYPWVHDRLAVYVAGRALIGLNDNTVHSVVGGSAGMLYFLNPSIAAGPEIFFNHFDSHQADYNRYGLELAFSFFL